MADIKNCDVEAEKLVLNVIEEKANGADALMGNALFYDEYTIIILDLLQNRFGVIRNKVMPGQTERTGE